jgi:hypothetical protein
VKFGQKSTYEFQNQKKKIGKNKNHGYWGIENSVESKVKLNSFYKATDKKWQMIEDIAQGVLGVTRLYRKLRGESIKSN